MLSNFIKTVLVSMVKNGGEETLWRINPNGKINILIVGNLLILLVIAGVKSRMTTQQTGYHIDSACAQRQCSGRALRTN